MRVQYYKSKYSRTKAELSKGKSELKEKNAIIRGYEAMARELEALKAQMLVNEELRGQQKQTMEYMQEEIIRQAKMNKKL